MPYLSGPARQLARVRRAARDMMPGCSRWHICAAAGELTRRVCLLSAPDA